MRKILVFFVLSVFSYSQKADLTSAILAFQKDDNEQAIEFIDIAYDKFIQKGLDQEKPKLISKFNPISSFGSCKWVSLFNNGSVSS